MDHAEDGLILKNIFLWLQRTALFILLIFPISLAFIYQIKSISANSDPYAASLLKPTFILFVIFLMVLFFRGGKEEDWLALFLVLGFALSIRLAMLLILDTEPSSDFLDTHLFALDVLRGEVTTNTKDYTYIPEAVYLNMTGLSFAALYKLFGASVETAKLFIVALSTFTTGLIYKVGKEISGDHRAGLLAAMFFAAFPSLVCYTGVLTSEHIAIFLIVLVSLLSLLFQKHVTGNQWRYSLVMYLLIGAVIGLVDWYRPVGFVLLVTFVISEIFYFRGGRKLALDAFRVAILLVAYFLVSNASLVITEKMHAVDLPSNRQRFGESILIGSNVDTGGRHNWGDYQIIKDAYKKKYYGDYNRAGQYLLNLALERIKDNKGKLPSLLHTKFNRIWKNNDQMFELSLVGSNDDELIANISFLDAWFYALTTILVIVTIVHSIRNRSSKEVFTMQLFILGLALILQITEAQMRYRTVLIPYFVILAALGMKNGLEYLHKFYSVTHQRFSFN